MTPLSSASDAGVRPGDVVLAINNKSIAGEPLDRATGLIANDKSNNISLTLGRPGGHNRSVSPMGFASSSYSPVSYPLPMAPSGAAGATLSPMMKPLPRSPNTLRRYDPASIQDQERQVYEEEKYTEQLAIKTTPYRSQAVVSPKPKTKHDHVIGSYLKMQHYPDAPVHGSPVPDSYLPAQSIQNQTKFTNAVKQAAPTAEELGFKLTYNSPIGLYSQENAVNTLKQTNPMTVKQPVSSVTYDPMKASSINTAGHGHIPKPVKLVPDDTLVDGADFARNLANSPTYRLVQELEGPGRHHDAVADRVYTPIPVYEERQFGETERHSPAQSASFKVSCLSSIFLEYLSSLNILSFFPPRQSLMNSLIAHPSV